MDGIDKYFDRTAVQNYSSFLVPALIFPATQRLIDYFAHFPSPDEFLRREIANWTVRVTADMDDDTRRAFINDVRSGLQAYNEEEGLNFPCRTNLALAFKG